MSRSTLLPPLLALIACLEVRGGEVAGSYPRRVSSSAFASSPSLSLVKPRVGFQSGASDVASTNFRAGCIDERLGTDSALSMRPTSLSFDAHVTQSPTSLWPSVIAANDEAIIPEYQAENAFQDQVSLSDIASDPVLQAAFAITAVAIVLLFAAKAIVTQLDEAVTKVAIDFDRVMQLKYPKKWGKFMDTDENEAAVRSMGAYAAEADRVQRIVEEMERLRNKDPEFVERVMQDIERMNRE